MGQSTDAILAYGVDLGDLGDVELDWLDPDNGDVGDQLETRLRREIAGFTEEWQEGSEGYFDRESTADRATGVQIVYHCSCDYPMYFLAVGGTVISASRGYPERLMKDLNVGPDWAEKITKGLEALGLEAREPDWYVFSQWC